MTTRDCSSFTAAYRYLSQARMFGLKLGLHTMASLTEAMGHPQEAGQFIHIAGTNGKGSTAAFACQVLRADGENVGLYTSPHLCSIRERIRVNGKMISPDEFARGITIIRQVAEERHLQPTFFEILTLLALWYFRERKVQWVVWETGLGGRLDATNIVRPKVTVITNIGMDHARYLGDTLKAIASEKAGIIKEGIPVVTAVDDGEAENVIARVAKLNQARLVNVTRSFSPRVRSVFADRVECEIDSHNLTLSLTGAHQVLNAACAYGALMEVRTQRGAVSLEAIRQGFLQAAWPGRFQVLQSSPPLVVDGAHNVEAIDILVQNWQSVFGPVPFHLVFGVLADKPFEKMVASLRPFVGRVSLVAVPSERTVSPESLVSLFSGIPTRVFPSLEEVWCQPEIREIPTLVTGSLFLVGKALSLVEPEAYPPGEFVLNDRL